MVRCACTLTACSTPRPTAYASCPAASARRTWVRAAHRTTAVGGCGPAACVQEAGPSWQRHTARQNGLACSNAYGVRAAFHAPVGEPHANPKPVAARGATAGQRSAAHNVIMLRLATHAGLTSRHHCARACCRLKSTTASCAAPMPRAFASMGWRRRRRRRWRCRRPSRSRRPSQRRGTRGVARWTECRSWLACPSSVRIQRDVFYENPYYNNAGAG